MKIPGQVRPSSLVLTVKSVADIWSQFRVRIQVAFSAVQSVLHSFQSFQPDHSPNAIYPKKKKKREKTSPVAKSLKKQSVGVYF